MNKTYKVWTCKIIIPGGSATPDGFDSPPRMAAEKAIEDAGFEVLINSSGWGGCLDEHDIAELERIDAYQDDLPTVAGDRLEQDNVNGGLNMRFTHDCDICEPIGQYLSHDLYFCGAHGGTVVARYGDDKGSYISGLWLPDPVIKVAIEMAKSAGYIE